MSDVADKWGDTIAARGFAQIPNYLLLLNQFLDPRLTPVELLLLIELVGAWWRKGDLPFPSVNTLATRCGVSGRQIQRAVAQLEKRELLQRVSRRAQGIISSNAYDLTPLISFLERVAKAFPNEYPRRVRPAKVNPAIATTPAAEATPATDAAPVVRKRRLRRAVRPFVTK